MIVYNVTVQIDHEIETEWLKWMQEVHIPDVLRTGLLTSCRLCRILGQPENPTGISFAVQYTCPSLEKFIDYRDNHAPALQAEHSERYKGRYAAFRTLLEVIAETQSPEMNAE